MELISLLTLKYPICTNTSWETKKLLKNSEEGLARYMQGSGFYPQHERSGAERKRQGEERGDFSNIMSLLAMLMSSI